MVRQNFNWDIITARSVVHVTAAEIKRGTAQVVQNPPTQDFFYHLGDATVWISNIGPHRNEFSGEPGGVEFHIHTGNIRAPIDVGITITVEDDLPVEIQGF